MYVYRTIIDVCGLCGDYMKSRYIYEVLSLTAYMIFFLVNNLFANALFGCLYIYIYIT